MFGFNPISSASQSGIADAIVLLRRGGDDIPERLKHPGWKKKEFDARVAADKAMSESIVAAYELMVNPPVPPEKVKPPRLSGYERALADVRKAFPEKPKQFDSTTRSSLANVLRTKK